MSLLSPVNRASQQNELMLGNILSSLRSKGIEVFEETYVFEYKKNIIKVDVGLLEGEGIFYLKLGSFILLNSRFKNVLGKEIPYGVIFLDEFKVSFNKPNHILYTASFMIALIEADVKDKIILDLGCAEGVLGLMALKKGAAKVFGVDKDGDVVTIFEQNKKINNIAYEQMVLIKKSFLDEENIRKVIGQTAVDIVFANIGPHYGSSDLEAFSMIHQLPSVKMVIAGGYNTDADYLSPTRALVFLGKMGFKKNFKSVNNKYGHYTFYVER